MIFDEEDRYDYRFDFRHNLGNDKTIVKLQKRIDTFNGDISKLPENFNLLKTLPAKTRKAIFYNMLEKSDTLYDTNNGNTWCYPEPDEIVFTFELSTERLDMINYLLFILACKFDYVIYKDAVAEGDGYDEDGNWRDTDQDPDNKYYYVTWEDTLDYNINV